MNRGVYLEWISAHVLQTAREYWRVPVLFNIIYRAYPGFCERASLWRPVTCEWRRLLCNCLFLASENKMVRSNPVTILGFAPS